MANIWDARWVGAHLSDLLLAARWDDQSVASPHLASEEESSALVGRMSQPPAQAPISISISIRISAVLPVQIFGFVVIEEYRVQHILYDPGQNGCFNDSGSDQTRRGRPR